MLSRILSIITILTVVSCQKTDFNNEADVTAAAANTDTIGWKQASQWKTSDQETFAVHYVAIEDAQITSDVADNGLVLLFKKNGAAINGLPLEENAAENNPSKYWYHQVSAGSLLISCDAYDNSGTPDVANTFKYFVVTPEKLRSLEENGYPTEKLMGLRYEEAAALLDNAR